jgi:CheY-like chemotaxis protein
MRAELVLLLGIAERLAAADNDRAALAALQRETHKIQGPANSYGFLEASRLAAGMEATVKDWASHPDAGEVDRGDLTLWFVTRLAAMLKLELPRRAATPPVKRTGAAAPPAAQPPPPPPRLIIRRPSGAPAPPQPPSSKPTGAATPPTAAPAPRPPTAQPPPPPPRLIIRRPSGAPAPPEPPPPKPTGAATPPTAAPAPRPSAAQPPPPPPRVTIRRPSVAQAPPAPPPEAAPPPPPPPAPPPEPPPVARTREFTWLIPPDEEGAAGLAGLAAPTAVPEPPGEATPAPPEPHPAEPAAQEAEPSVAEPPSEAVEVISVEDDAALAELLEYGLRSRGYRFLAYRNGREALRELLALDVHGTHPLLLLDVDLPALDGYSILDALQRERPGTYRVVFTTVHGSEEEQLRGLEAGALDYMVKPISLRVALEKIKRWVGR